MGDGRGPKLAALELTAEEREVLQGLTRRPKTAQALALRAGMVLAVDEKSQMQALDRTAPMLPMMPGAPGRTTHDYVRHGTTSLFAALDVATGTVIGQIHRKHRHQEFLRFLKTIDKATPAEVDLHLVLDNYATHKTRRSTSGWSSIRGSICTSPRPTRPGSTSSNGGSPS